MNKEANTCARTDMHAHTEALSRHLQYGARSEASGLSGNRTFTYIVLVITSQKCGLVCVCCVGCCPKRHYSSCHHDEHMILYVCPFTFVCRGHLISCLGRFMAEAAINVVFFPCFFFFFACHFSESQCLTKPSRTANMHAVPLTCKQLSVKTH